jgi:enoyl-CoA hydratase
MSFIRMSVQDGLADVVLDRPKVNAMNLALIRELGQTFEQIAADPSVRGALLRSEGKSFSAGLDLKEVSVLDRAGLIEFLEGFDRSIRAAFSCPKPVAAAVSGHAIAGGLVLALGTDFLALGKGDYRVGLTELAVGVPFPRLAFEIVKSAVPARALRRLVYTAENLPPSEAFELGVGDVLAEDPVAAARGWLDVVSSRPTLAFQVAKRQMRADAWARIDAAGPAEREDFIDGILRQGDAVQGTLR